MSEPGVAGQGPHPATRGLEPAGPRSLRAHALAVVAIAADAAAVLALGELAVLAVRAPGARRLAVLAPIGLSALAVFALCALPIAAAARAALLLAERRLSRAGRTGVPRVARFVIAGAGALLALGALRTDAGAYVRLYAGAHALAGLAVLAGAVIARAVLFDATTRGAKVRAALVALAALASPWLLTARLDARAYAAQRGVLLADALWAVRPEVWSLPPSPSQPPAPSFASDASPTPVARPRLVLLVTIDALRTDAARSSSYPAFATIRRNAAVFTEARTTAAWTVPAVWSLLTSRGPWNTRFEPARFFGDQAVAYTGPSHNPRRVWPLPLHETAPTLAESLARAGYQTRVCATLPFQHPSTGLTRGFADVDLGVYHARNDDLRGTTSDLLTACAIAQIQRAGDAPLFLWLHYSDPHEPYAPHPGLTDAGQPDEVRYAGEVAFVDRHLAGLLLNVQRMVGMARTLLVVAADHGEEFGEHGGSYHAVTLYDEVARVPLWVAGPGISPREVSARVTLLDVAPTVLALLGLPPLAGAEGRSLVGAMRGEPLEPRALFAESVRYGRAVRSVVDGPYKLVYEARAGTYELFDLARDPGEQWVLSDERRDVVARLAREMGVPAP